MVFIEATIMGIVGIILGSLLSNLLANIVLNNINTILNSAGYYFKLVFNAKYLITSLFIIIINIYFSVLIPSLKASSSSVIQGIRGNKEIKNKKRKTILEKLLPTEGRIAIKNIRRNKSKYRLIIFLLIVCITSFISLGTYLRYEKETADLMSEYDVDAILNFYDSTGNTYNYIAILKKYEKIYGSKVNYMEEKVNGGFFLIEPEYSLMPNYSNRIFDNATISMNLIALDNATYTKYIHKLNAKYGDLIIYNSSLKSFVNSETGETLYRIIPVFKENSNLKLTLIRSKYSNNEYELVNSEILDKQVILTTEILEGYKEIKLQNFSTLFMNMETYNKLDNYIEENYGTYKERFDSGKPFWYNLFDFRVKIKCDNIVEFKNYMEKTIEEQNLDMSVEYYTLENQEKLMYISIVELILKVMMIAIITIGIVSTVNIINASLIERKEDFNIMYRMGATKGNIKKVLIYECIYMFIKATAIAIILSIPIIWKIIKHMENVLVLNKLLIPFGSIAIFIGILFVISLVITLYSTKMIKEE